jgi:hypothetical protein
MTDRVRSCPDCAGDVPRRASGSGKQRVYCDPCGETRRLASRRLIQRRAYAKRKQNRPEPVPGPPLACVDCGGPCPSRPPGTRGVQRSFCDGCRQIRHVQRNRDYRVNHNEAVLQRLRDRRAAKGRRS